jgi:UDP-N-acetylmuramoylalanine--D-glutamate ligase
MSADANAAATFAGERAVVVGYGASGRASLRALLASGAEAWVTENRSAAEVSADLDPSDPVDRALDVRAGGHRPDHLDGATLVILSPGVRPDAPVVAWARERGLPVWGELEVGARLCRVPYVAVTGTNGKTTTSEMVAAAMRASGLSARACGNVGYPFPRAAREPFDALVVEASSFQLAFQSSLRPRVSVLLNVAADHLDWHGSFAAYADAKARVFAGQGGDDVHVGNAGDAEAAALSRRAPCQVRWFRGAPPSDGEVGVVDGAVVAATDGGPIEVARPRSRGRGFLADAAAAAVAALGFGLPLADVRDALSSFAPLPHRGEIVAETGGVAFVDDSKATNPHATLEALDGASNVVLIAGGLAKGVDLSPLAAGIPALAAVVAIGRDAAAVEAVFDGLVETRRAATMDEAVLAAFEMAPRGGTVLLAPACASQDMFRDYADRGDRFAEAARGLAAARNQAGSNAH